MMYDMKVESGGEAGLPDVVGVIGIGIMGRPMAANLIAASGEGTKVLIHHPSAERAASLVTLGAEWVATPREMAARARAIVLMVPDLPQVDEVLRGDDGILAGVDSPLTLIICSTSSAEGLRELADRLSDDHGGLVRIVDAPVSGGEDGAIAGTLAIMVGGASDDVSVAMPVLGTMGTPVHLGPLGSGAIAKFCNQMIVASTIMALGEAAVIAERSGIDLGKMFDLLEGGYAGSRVLATRKDRIVTGDYSPSGPAKFMVKDLTYAVQEAERTSTNAAQLRTLLTLFTDLTDSGFGDQDIAVTRGYIESKSTLGRDSS